MSEFLLALGLMCLATVSIAAQNQKACSMEQANQFDFWVGTWDLEWTDAQGKKQRGTNTISKILGGCVVEENFSTAGASPFIGRSHSVFDAKDGQWKQTWVDNAGAYLELAGSFEAGKMTLLREMKAVDGKKTLQRMIFSSIQKDSILWDWESSIDGGKTWVNNWKINYKRRS